jgi:hypothetical protein
LSPDTLQDVERLVSQLRGLRTSQSAKGKRKRADTRDDSEAPAEEDHNQEDGYDSHMPIPHSVLKECTENFLAADEACTKASTQFFDDTGVMALLCRHDQVLWVVNMKSASEKQFYALALIQTLFQHLPGIATVGILYDVACKLQESCVKWGFLKDILHRIIFGVSVFHAYGPVVTA